MHNNIHLYTSSTHLILVELKSTYTNQGENMSKDKKTKDFAELQAILAERGREASQQSEKLTASEEQKNKSEEFAARVKTKDPIQGIEIQESDLAQPSASKESKGETKESIAQDYENTLKRLQADFENYIKRTEKEKQDFAKYTSAKTITKFLAILDSLDNAMLVLENENNSEIKTGIQMIHKQFHKILEEEGVKPMACKNKKFDPYCHEIIDMIEHELEEGTIVEELQRGYHIHDKVLRTAKVRVSHGKNNDNKTKTKEK